MRTHPRRWIEIMKGNLTLWDNLFLYYVAILDAISVSPTGARNRMLQLYENAVTTYTDDYIEEIFSNNLVTNGKKYAELVKLHSDDLDVLSPVDMTESFVDTRRPNLTTTSNSSSERKQSQTSTTTPLTTETTTHSVNPYDNTGMQQQTQDATSMTGSNTTTISFTGQPDTASGTTTRTGSETLEHSATRKGRDGRFTLSQIIEEAELSAARLDILDIIINDLADQIFLQVWL